MGSYMFLHTPKTFMCFVTVYIHNPQTRAIVSKPNRQKHKPKTPIPEEQKDGRETITIIQPAGTHPKQIMTPFPCTNPTKEVYINHNPPYCTAQPRRGRKPIKGMKLFYSLYPGSPASMLFHSSLLPPKISSKFICVVGVAPIPVSNC